MYFIRKEGYRMNILIFHSKSKKTIIDYLKETESIEEVAKILKPFRDRTVFIEIINELLNENSDLETENKKIKKDLKEKEEVELL